MDRSREESLRKIRDLGIIHLNKKSVSSPALTKLLNRHSQLETVSGILDVFTPKKGSKTVPSEFEGDLAGYVAVLYERRGKLQDYMFRHQREKSRFEKWGNFNPDDFRYLAEHGVNAYLYELPLDAYEKIAGDEPVFVLAKDEKNNTIRLVTFGKIEGRAPYPLPERSLAVVEERNAIRRAEMAKIENELASLSFLKGRLKDEIKANLTEIEFETAKAGMEKSELTANAGPDLSVSWITGFVPGPDMEKVQKAARENNWAFCSEDPSDDDEVPTKLQNNKFVSLIYPVFDFLEMIPGYRERDISLWFLVFFMLFFAMIFGDAAYGSILVLTAIAGILKTRKNGVPAALRFLLLMSISNAVWGTLVCSWFAMDVALVPKFLQNISLPLIANTSAQPGWLASYNAGNFWIRLGLVKGFETPEIMKLAVKTNLMYFCFSIALVQLSIAHIIRIADNIRSPKIIGEFGSMCMLFGMYFVLISLVADNAGFSGVKPWQFYFLAGGFVLVFIFGKYEDGLLKSIKASVSDLINVILGITNVFSDIMSYIRLWAVGIAGASIAVIINSYAGPLFGRLVFFLIGIVFFAFGHGFNMVLNVLSVLVHGVRLNTLEFSSHVGLNWTGFSYKPFVKR